MKVMHDQHVHTCYSKDSEADIGEYINIGDVVMTLYTDKEISTIDNTIFISLLLIILITI